MSGKTLQLSNAARENKMQALAVSILLSISVLLQGTFFLWQWLILGAVVTIVLGFMTFRNRSRLAIFFTLTDIFFLSLITLSLLGLLNPVKASEGWFDVLRWFVLWLVYRFASYMDKSTYNLRKIIINLCLFLCAIELIILLLNLFIKIDLPYLNSTLSSTINSTIDSTNRWTSIFGYSNAFGVFCGTALLLKPNYLWQRLIIFLALLNTGSRGAIVLFILVWIIQSSFYLYKILYRRKILAKGLMVKGVGIFFVLLTALFITIITNPLTVNHLKEWGLTSSIGERILYLIDGIQLAILNKGLPIAGGWFAFPLVQGIPYWAIDPHSILTRILIHQGVIGLVVIIGWGILTLKKLIRNKIYYQVEFMALIFLAIHAVFDADFLFGSLGVLFWILFGLLDRKDNYNKIGGSRRFNVFLSALLLSLSLGMIFLCVQPGLFIANGIDQTNNTLRRQLAASELKKSGSQGLEAMDQVLNWEKFDLRTYEWAQVIVLHEAEKLRPHNPREAFLLYQWVETVPERIELLKEVNRLEHCLWPEVDTIQASELNNLLKEYAQERQLALYPPST